MHGATIKIIKINYFDSNSRRKNGGKRKTSLENEYTWNKLFIMTCL